MPKRPKLRHDANEVAFQLVQKATGQEPKASGKNPEAVKRGKKGGKIGGPARAEALTDRQLKNIARNAARKRWKGEQSA
jgi:hypothetical protein